MANVLGELFGNIANAIRSKTGDTGTMKPAEFPQKISGIEGGSGGNGNAASFSYTKGSFTATAAQMTVPADFGGTKPDILLVMPDHIPTSNCVVYSIGYSSALHEALGGGYIAPTCVLAAQGGSLTISNNVGMEHSSDIAATYGGVRNVTQNSFTIGSATYGLYVGKGYSWFAISGITRA